MPVKLPTYDSSKVSDLTFSTVSQSGYSSPAAQFISSAFPITPVLYEAVGFSYDFSITTESERGLSLGATRPFTAVTSDLAGTGESSVYWTLTVPTNITDITTIGTVFPLILYLVRSANPSVWSGSTNHPEANAEESGVAALLEIIHKDTDQWVLNSNGSTYDMVFNFDFTANFTESDTSGSEDSRSGAVVLHPFHTIVNDASWGGLIQFLLRYEKSDLAVSLTSTPTFAGKTHKAHTGTIGMPLDRRARVVHDYITNQTYLSDEAVPDGYRHGIMIHPDNFDPVDPLEDDPFTPPPNEGITDDEVIDLE